MTVSIPNGIIQTFTECMFIFAFNFYMRYDAVAITIISIYLVQHGRLGMNGGYNFHMFTS